MVDKFGLRANIVEKSQKLERLRILPCPFVLDEIRPSVVFSKGAWVGARARAGEGTWVQVCRGVGAGVTMSAWACGCPGVPA